MVAIKDMEMPNECAYCVFCTNNWKCILLNKRANNIVGYHAKLSDCPLVEIEEHKIGEWVIDDYEEMNHITRVYRAHCSLCKKDPLNFVYGTESWFTYKHKLPRFCPNCGADMKGDENILKE